MNAQGTLGQIATLATAAAVRLRERDELIRQARAGGATLAELAKAAGMSRSGIVRVLEREA